jgi:phosphohistidine swiveling domain-containing protein
VKNVKVKRRYSVHNLEKAPGNEEFVLNIIDNCGVDLVGGKAFDISKMAAAGFPVPRGFCITTRAYDYFIDFNSMEEDEKSSKEIQHGTVPPRLEEAILKAYKEYLDTCPCVVRSSSPFEDSKSASFAGQYKSFLNIEGEKALLDAVTACWASLWDRSAAEYRKKMGICEDVKMAILVQEMIPATASGVLFTEDKMIIDAVWGLGDVLVGGKVVADHFVVERKKFDVLEQTISHKHTMSEPVPEGGVHEIEIPKPMRDIPVLDDKTLRNLCLIGEKVEDLFGGPQDMEWALHNSKIVLLQARPITVKQTPTVWSRANISEMQPGYVTYLSRPPENKPDFFVFSTLPFLQCFGIKEVPENVKFAEYIYGHIYMNMTNIHNFLCAGPLLSPEFFDYAIGHSGSEEVPHLNLIEIVRIIPGALRLIRLILTLPGQAETIIPQTATVMEDVKSKNLEVMTVEELDGLVWKLYEINQEVFQVHACNALALAVLFNLLEKFLRRIGEERAEDMLITGLDGMSSYRLGVEMWKLAQSASKSSRVSQLILSRKENIVESLSQFPEGIEFLEILHTFFQEFGDRCAEEPELSTPRWRETPQFVLSMVANYLTSQANPVEKLEEEKSIRRETTDRILQKLKNPFERLLFEKILSKTQEYAVTRENLKTTWAKGLSVTRILYLKIAEILVEENILKTRDDIFCLKMTEVSHIIAGNIGREKTETLIRRRKKEKEDCEHLNVPMVIVGKPSPPGELKYTIEPKRILEGTVCSHGVVTGKARIVLDPSKHSEFEEGEILVASVTDPGWSPLFVIAGGLVMELGSKGSHSVIIAREYGIPAVAGVKGATRIIRTGQRITVDGNKGLVYIRE